MLGQIVINNQNIFSLVHEILCQGSRRIGRDVLNGCCFTGGGRHDGGVFHGTVLLQVLHERRHGGLFLADGHVNTNAVLVFLVNDGVHGNGGFSRLPVADDELTLATANGEHGIDGQNTGLHGFADGLSVNDTRRRLLNGTIVICDDAAVAVDGLAQGIDHTAQEAVTHRNTGAFTGSDAPAAFYDIAFIIKKDDTHAIPGNVLHHALHAVVKQDHLTIHGMIQAVHLHNAVTHGDDKADFPFLRLQIEVGNGIPQDGDNVGIAGKG